MVKLNGEISPYDIIYSQQGFLIFIFWGSVKILWDGTCIVHK